MELGFELAIFLLQFFQLTINTTIILIIFVSLLDPLFLPFP